MPGLAYELSDRMTSASQAVLADLDLDGALDLVRVEISAGTARLQTEFGDGMIFTAGLSFLHSENYVARLIAGDWDQDGDPDLLTLGGRSALGPFQLRRWRNEGSQDGQWRGLTDAGLLDFTPTMPANSKPSVLLEDVNGDGTSDLILGAQQLEVRFGRGAGDFGSPVKYDRMSTGRTVAIGDMDGDLDLDLVTAVPGDPGRMSILINDGEGFFEERQQLTTGQQPWHIALGDADADGDLDVAMAHRWFDEGLSLWLNQGDSTLDANRRRFPIAGNPVEVAWNDIDGDRDLDLVVATAYAQHVPQWRQVDGGTAVLINLGGGRLDEPLYLACCEPLSLLVEDLDRDGAAEIIATGENSTIMRATDSSPFLSEASQFIVNDTLVRESLEVLSEDVNGDGRADVVSLDRMRHELTITLSMVDARFVPLPPISVVGSHVYAQRSVDGQLDLLVTTELPGGAEQITWLDGQGDGTFRFTGVLELPGSLAEQQPFVDFDGDGDLDLVVASPVAQVWIANEQGAFQPGPALPVTQGESWRWVDWNADRRSELLVWSDEEMVLRAWKPVTGTSFWQIAATLATTGAMVDVLAADVDADGRADLIVNERLATTSNVTIWRQQDFEQFARGLTMSVVGAIQDMATADVEGDGQLEVVASSIDSNVHLTQGIVVIRSASGGTEDGTLEWTEYPLEIRNSLGGTQATGSLRVSDLDRDGRDDVVLPMSFWGRTGPQPGGALVVWMGNPDGLTRPVYHVYRDAGYFQTVSLNDVDGDGWSDIIASGDAGFAWVRQRRPERVAGDVTSDGQVTSVDIDRFCAAIRSELPPDPERSAFDLDGDSRIGLADYAYLIDRILRTTAGDANLDGVFDSRDLLLVFQGGRFESNGDALWQEGDWNCDGRFDTSDLLAAFQAGSYR